MNQLKPIQHSFDDIAPHLPEYTRYRIQRAINTDTLWNRRAIFQNTLNHLYRKHLTLGNPRIVVCTGIAHDGFGDLTHAVHASTVLKDNLSSPHTTLICSITSLEKRKNALNGRTLKAANEFMFAEDFSENQEQQIKAQKVIDTTEVVVKVATGSTMTNVRGLSIEKANHLLQFSELGLTGGGTTGFAPCDLGVPIPIDTQLPILDDQDLATLLSERSDTPNYSLHLGYVKRYEFQNAFFATCCLAAKSPTASIDIVMPLKDICSPGWTETEEWGDGEVEFAWALNQLGLKQIALYVRDKENNKLICKQVRTFGEIGLNVRIINPFPVSPGSFAFLSLRSELCNGCTGDFSFLETAVGNKPQIPFYEILGHKSNFYQGFLEFLKGPLSETSPLLNFFQSLLLLKTNPPIKELFRIAQTIAHTIQAPGTRQEMQNLSAFIKERFNFNEVLLDAVSREIAHVRYPKLQELEQRLCNDFCANPSLLNSAYTRLNTTLMQLAHPAPLLEPGLNEDEKMPNRLETCCSSR